MLTKNFIDLISYDIDGYYDCENNGCKDEGICRCYTINAVTINNIDITSMSNLIFTSLFDTNSIEYKRDNKINELIYGFDNEIDIYCIDRILRINKLYNPSSWNPEWGPGYYGDELESINMDDIIYKKVIDSIDKIRCFKTLKEKVEYVLIEEYGFLLNKVKNKNYKVVYVNIEDIIFTQFSYSEKVKAKDEDTYKKFLIPIKGVCLKNNNKWNIIDGYHRLTSHKGKKVKIIGLYD